MRLRTQRTGGAAMDIGIGLPSSIRGVDRDSLLESARRADAAGFSTAGTIDRLVFPNYEPLAVLAAAAAVTERIKLATTILLAPLRANHALFAKQAATIDHLSEGRLVLGLGVGLRPDDFEASGLDFETRGKVFDRQLEEMTRIWSGERKGVAGPIGPPPMNGERPAMLLGGSVSAAFERAARYGDGWISGAAGPDTFAEGAARAKAPGERAGRGGSPRLCSLHYFSLGPDAKQHARNALGDYYGFLGEEIAEMIVANAATTEEEVQQAVAAFDERGCDELILCPCSKDPEQVALLAGAVGQLSRPSTG